MASDQIAFGTWVRLRRQALVLTREELASRVGCAEVTIRKIEADERKPSPQIAELLAQHLGLPADQRELFVRVARGIVPVAQLPPPILGAPVASTSILPSPPPAATLPSGTVTFLFTDIEGSTQRWEQHPEAMSEALARHDTLVREAIELHNGHVFKTVGDAFCAAFGSAPDALRAAIAGQRAIVGEDWGTIAPIRVRMALHTGTADLQAGNYLGQPLNRIARLLAAGHGGQILLSLATHELVRDHLPERASLRDLGSHRLRDLVRPESIFQANAADLPYAFPPLKSLDVRTNNLPAQVNTLIGRTQEVATVRELLNRARLVTLTGPGGTGKTRLALQIVAGLLDQYSDGVWFVDLSPVSDPEQLASAIAQVLGIPESPDRPIRNGVVYWLHERQVLLILDNCEQVIDGAADLVAELLRRAPRLTILATSRIPLRVAAEQEYAVVPLALPALGALPALDHFSQYDAVALFIARARAMRADFAVTNQTAPAVAEICTRLDGLPLAIELAAARIRLFSPEQLLSRLMSAHLQTLTGGTRDMPARQQTIRATLDWSFRLLMPAQQTLLARLGVFVGGWTLEAAEAVCSDPVIDFIEALDSLIEQSLVRVQEMDGVSRYTMLETIREYALERLAERGEPEQIQQRHAEYFTALAEEAEPKLRSVEQLLWLARLEADNANLITALVWMRRESSDAHNQILGLRLAIGLWRYWLLTNRIDQALQWLDADWMIAHHLPVSLRARALVLMEVVDAWFNGIRFFHKRLISEALTFIRASGDRFALALAYAELALFKTGFVGEAAIGYAEESRTIAQELQDSWLMAYAELGYGTMLHFVRHLPDASVAYMQRALTQAQQTGDRWLMMCGQWTIGLIQLEQQKFQDAHISFTEQLHWCTGLGTSLGRAYGLWGLGSVALHYGDLVLAKQYNLERSATEALVGNSDGINSGLLMAAVVEMDLGNFTSAHTYFTQARETLAILDRTHRQFIVGHHRLADQALWPVLLALYSGDYEGARYKLDFRKQVVKTLQEAGEDIAFYIQHIKAIDGIISFAQNDRDHAQQQLQAVRAVLPDHWEATLYAGYIASYAEAHDDAQQLLQHILILSAREQSGDWERSHFVSSLGEVLIRAGNVRAALPYLQRSLAYFRRADARLWLTRSFEQIAVIPAMPTSTAAHLLGAAEALREQIGAPMWPIHRSEYEQRVANAKERTTTNEWAIAWAAGRALTWEQAADEALIWLRDAQELV